MSRRTPTRAPAHFQAPPASATTRRTLFGTMGAMLMLTAAEASPAEASNPDAELLAACQAFHAAHAVYWGPDAGDEIMLAADKAWHESLERLADLRPVTRAGMRAKVQAIVAAFRVDVKVYTESTLEEQAQPHEYAAWKLLHDVLAMGAV